VRLCARSTSLFCRGTALSYNACIATILLESRESGWYNESTSSVYRAEMTAAPAGRRGTLALFAAPVGTL
jgi:hypothetical protein